MKHEDQLLINSLIKYGLATHNGDRRISQVVTLSQAIPKLQTHNLVHGFKCVSDWPKVPNMVPRHNLGGNSISSHSPLARTYCGLPFKFYKFLIILGLGIQ